MADHEALVQQLCAITQTDAARARHFLSAANWDIDLAAEMFFTTGQESAPPAAVAPPPAAPPASSSSAPKPAAQPARPGFATLRDFRSGSDDEDEDKDNEYYSGGAVSGMAVEGKPRNERKRPGQELFDTARKHGASAPEAAAGQAGKSRAFVGAGFKLGGENVPSQQVGTPQSAVPQPTMRKVTVTVWSNGFSIDDGENQPELLTFQENEGLLKSILASMQRGEVPREFHKYGQDVDMHFEDNRGQEFVPPKKKIKTFTGAGHRLGAPTEAAPSSSDGAPMQTISHAVASTPAPAPTASMAVNEALPVTKLQIKLANGTRLVARFNHTHTIADVRRFIQSAQSGSPPFVLYTAFPAKKVITDETQTLEQCGLLNAVVMQQYA